MNKQEFANELAERCDFSKAEAGRAVDAMLDSVTEALTDRDEVNLPGFGKFVTQKRRGREGTDPRNPDRKIRIAPAYVAKFRPGSALRRAVGDAAPAEGASTRSRRSPSTATRPELASAQSSASRSDGAPTGVAESVRGGTSDLGWKPLSER